MQTQIICLCMTMRKILLHYFQQPISYVALIPIECVSPLDDFGPWEAKGFEPEATFLEKIKAIDGVSVVETQTITNMEVS